MRCQCDPRIGEGCPECYAQEVPLEQQLVDEQENNRRLKAAIADVSMELGIGVCNPEEFFKLDALEAIKHLKEQIGKRREVTDDEMLTSYVQRDPTAGVCFVELATGFEKEFTHVVISRVYWEGLQRTLGQFGIDQMKAAVDIMQGARQWYEEDWDVGAPCTDATLAMAKACTEYNRLVVERSK